MTTYRTYPDIAAGAAPQNATGANTAATFAVLTLFASLPAVALYNRVRKDSHYIRGAGVTPSRAIRCVVR
jgi:hypothetical protein